MLKIIVMAEKNSRRVFTNETFLLRCIRCNLLLLDCKYIIYCLLGFWGVSDRKLQGISLKLLEMRPLFTWGMFVWGAAEKVVTCSVDICGNTSSGFVLKKRSICESA